MYIVITATIDISKFNIDIFIKVKFVFKFIMIQSCKALLKPAEIDP